MIAPESYIVNRKHGYAKRKPNMGLTFTDDRQTDRRQTDGSCHKSNVA